MQLVAIGTSRARALRHFIGESPRAERQRVRYMAAYARTADVPAMRKNIGGKVKC